MHVNAAALACERQVLQAMYKCDATTLVWGRFLQRWVLKPDVLTVILLPFLLVSPKRSSSSARQR